MCNVVLNSLKYKADKWKKMVNIDECKYVPISIAVLSCSHGALPQNPYPGVLR